MKRIHAWVALACLLPTSAALAGPYTDDLSKCLVESSTDEEKTTLVQWIFVAMAHHPSVASMANITPEVVEKHNAAVGKLFTQLLTEACADKTVKAMKYERNQALAQAFQVLGQVAAGSLFADPGVAAIMTGLEKYFDKEKFDALAK